MSLLADRNMHYATCHYMPLHDDSWNVRHWSVRTLGRRARNRVWVLERAKLPGAAPVFVDIDVDMRTEQVKRIHMTAQLVMVVLSGALPVCELPRDPVKRVLRRETSWPAHNVRRSATWLVQGDQHHLNATLERRRADGRDGPARDGEAQAQVAGEPLGGVHQNQKVPEVEGDLGGHPQHISYCAKVAYGVIHF